MSEIKYREIHKKKERNGRANLNILFLSIIVSSLIFHKISEQLSKNQIDPIPYEIYF